MEPNSVLSALNCGSLGGFHFPLSECAAVRVFTRFSRDFLTPVDESDRVSIRRLDLPARNQIVLAAAYLPSKLYSSDDSQGYECAELSRQIVAGEEKVGHQRTVLVGDLNVNPFEHGMISSGGLHAVSSRKVASRGSRTVRGREYPFFYNPMWGHFGDAAGDTAGSYYYERAQHVNYFWNLFDQVLIRPELARSFDPSQLRIVKSIGSRSLVRQDGTPDSKFSDHLPIVFELEF